MDTIDGRHVAHWLQAGARHRLRAHGGRQADNRKAVDIELDTRPRTVTIPDDLAAALDAEPAARSTFDGLSYSNTSWHVLHVTGAKTEETRQQRIAKSVAALRAGRSR